jgi:formate dehydrogenase (coenzyme F420) beta subunit
MKVSIPVIEGNTTQALQGFLKQLLESGKIEALLVPMRTPAGTVTPALVSHPELLSSADPLAPVLPVNAATLAGKLSVREPRAKVGVVLRACELRALVELTKMQQASLDNLVLISIDCAGTYSVPEFQRQSLAQNQAIELWQELFQAALDHPDSPAPAIRQACQICEHPEYKNADIRIELLGNDYQQHLSIDLSEEWAACLDISAEDPAGVEDSHAIAVQKLVEARTALRDAEFNRIRQRLGGSGAPEANGTGPETITGVFAACIRCHNCMNVCPICYCKTCVFKSEVFDHEPMQYLHWAKQKGAYRLPSDSMLFHMTRLNHMALSCVGCGMCTEACPAELPVGMVFRAIGGSLQQTFDYSPGSSAEEPLPLITFKADEWNEVGEHS